MNKRIRKKKEKQWFIGLLFVIYGGFTLLTLILCIYNFINMMNTTGKEFVIHISHFSIELAGFLILSNRLGWYILLINGNK